jgi:hypothetical protein
VLQVAQSIRQTDFTSTVLVRGTASRKTNCMFCEFRVGGFYLLMF